VWAGEAGKRGSGWLLDRRRRLLVTSAEAAGKGETVTVVFPVWQDGQVVAEPRFYRDERLLMKKGVLVRGWVLATDARRNLALIELATVPTGVEELHFAAGRPAPGDPVHLLGNPDRAEVLWVYAAGRVRQRGHANLGQTRDGPDPAVLAVQAPLADGEGGGPVLDGRGELVGVIAGKSGPQQLVSYCLEIGEVRDFLAAGRPSWRPGNAAELCERGTRFLGMREYGRAVADFTEALRLDPRCARAFSGRGQARDLAGDCADAVRDCDRALELDPRLAEAYAHRASALCALGAPRRALADCDQALRLRPRFAAAHAVRGHARFLLGDGEAALADCDEAIWLDRQPRAYLYRGLIHAAAGKPDRALEDYNQALALDPRLAAAWRARADVYWGKSDVAAALADYDRALALDPRDAGAHLGRGRARAARGDRRPAVADFTAALRLDPRLADAYRARGGERLRLDNVDHGLADYAAYIRLRPRQLSDVVQDLERRAGELSRGDGQDPVRCADLGRRALATLRPFVADRPDLLKAIDTGLTSAAAEKDPGRRAAALRAVLAEIHLSLERRTVPPRP
jgi:tetratricopeptide (TPR) repeat protein